MDNRQNSKKNMYNKMLLFFTENGTVWTAFTLLVSKVALFVSKNGMLEAYIVQQEQSTTGITTDKENKIEEMVDLTVNAARKAKVWAIDSGNAIMEELFTVRNDELLVLAGNVAVARCKDIRDGLNDNITALVVVNLFPADVTAISAAITAVEAVLGAPSAAEAAREASTTGIETTMVEMDAILDSIGDLLIPEYETSNPDMVLEFKNDRKIINTGGRHNGVRAELVYVGTSDPVQGITMKLLGTEKEAVSDILGKVEIIKVKADTYYIEFRGPGVVTKVERITIVRGNILDLKMELERL